MQWSTAWTKLLKFIMQAKKLPDTFAAADIEVPKRYAYMLQAQLADVGLHRPDSEVKAEEPVADRKSASSAHAAEKVGGEGPLPGLPGRIYQWSGFTRECLMLINTRVSARHVRRAIGNFGQHEDINQTSVSLATIYTFSSSCDVDRANVMDMECLVHLLQSHFLTQHPALNISYHVVTMLCWHECLLSCMLLLCVAR